MSPICKFCDEKDCQTHCQGSPDGEHRPDMSTGVIVTTDHGLAAEVDFAFKCYRCDVVGLGTIRREDIIWE